jgi:hypothetical protein
MQKKELALAAVKVRADELLRSRDSNAPGYKDVAKQKRRLGSFSVTVLLVCSQFYDEELN